MPLPIGRFIVGAEIQGTLLLTRTLPTVVDNYIELGEFTTNTGRHALFVAVKATGSATIYKQFGLSLNMNHTGGAWFRVLPLDETLDPVQDYELDVITNGATAKLRLRRKSGSGTLNAQIVVQNIGTEDSNFMALSGTGYAVAPTIDTSSIPYGISSTDHNQLANRGVYTHAQIDSHINASAPHAGHEVKTAKNAPSGYAGLDSSGKIPTSSLYVGNTSGTVCAGDDVRLAGGLPPGAHKSTHEAGGSDELNLGNIPGTIPQARSHGSPDTDMSATALHHTIGTGANQAAAGNHHHNGIYAPITKGVTNGDLHDHSGGDGGIIDHSSLANSGAVSHADLDSHVADTSPHTGHEKIINKDQPGGYLGLGMDGKIDSSRIPFGDQEGTVCEGNDPRLDASRPPIAHAETHTATGSDPITLSTLSGTLSQSRTHDAPDTDLSETSLHHTLGTEHTQAAYGDHNHDGAYAPIGGAVTNGDLHDHSGGDGAQIDHTTLSNIGANSHAAIDAHISASTPHVGHEILANKDHPGGYVGLSTSGVISGNIIPYGNQANTVCEGNDPRLSNPRAPTAHASTHEIGGTDALSLNNIDGSTTQSKTHDFADTDSSPTALHHTLGTGANQAAPGNHDHNELYDTRYAAITDGVTGGNSHTHSTGDGGQIDHKDLANKGTNTHAAIDAHISAPNPHSGHEIVSNKNAANGYAGLDTAGKLLTSAYTFGTSSGTVCEGNDPRLSDARAPSAHAESHGALGSDPLTLSDLDGNLDQSRSHDNSDTDSAPTAIHHTLGTGANQAAAGNHGHEIAGIDGLYAALDAKISLTEKGEPNGVATLDIGGKIPESQLPASIVGQVEYRGVWDADTNSPPLDEAAPENKGWYYIVNVSGTWNDISFDVGDWVISNGLEWSKVDNNDSVTQVFGRTGNILPIDGDYTASQITNVPHGNITSTTVQDALNELDADKSDTSHIHAASGLTNDSSVVGASIKDALDIVDNRLVPLENHTHGLANILYVAKNGDNTTGDGSYGKPYLTIQAAVNRIITSNDNTSKPYIIVVAPGTYDETVMLNNAALRNIHIVGAEGAETAVTVNGITSNSDNSNLALLELKHLQIGALLLQGNSNNTGFCSNDFELTGCIVSSATFSCINVVTIGQSKLDGNINFVNVPLATIAGEAGMNPAATLNVRYDSTLPFPMMGASTYVILESVVAPAISMSNSGGGTCTVQLRKSARIGTVGSTTTIGWNCTLINFGSVIRGTVVNNGTIFNEGDYYDNSVSGLLATNTQAALDELAGYFGSRVAVPVVGENLTNQVTGTAQQFAVSRGSYIPGTLKVNINGMAQLRTVTGQESLGQFIESDPATGLFRFADDAVPTVGDFLTVDYSYRDPLS